MSKIILLNGPKECGKNSVLKHIKCALFDVDFVDRRCKDKLYELTQELFCVSEQRFFEIYNDRALKEVPLTDFMLSTPQYAALRRYLDGVPFTDLEESFFESVAISIREAMIYVSELVCKPAFGQDYFGKARALSIQDGEVAVDDSCGFDGELPPTVAKLGQENILLIRIRGRGSFEGDSRNFIRDGVIDNTHDIWNNTYEASYNYEVFSIISEFLWG